ncbi:peptidoglycan-binding domain-containing protein [Aureimonas leprariae]|uniref:Peptidoglycan-binding protein n=1 Tax=Plantimonas leprariae TaxID=2615207 RepID=A0A7V7TWL6_9HYPH|nr:peptidoglycan-binding protein [Aureimonas leprariae]KAB0679965.1 peptidoglycan-binding protein [Aureimonas leprariae]
MRDTRKPNSRSRKPVARRKAGPRALAGVARLAVAAARPIARRPATSASLAAFAAFFGILATNALTAQTGRHMHPLLATRPGAASAPVAGNDAAPGGLSVPLVVEVQTALAEAGYYGLPVDGRPGPATSAAIRSYQSDHGLGVDGEASPRLLAAMRGDGETRGTDDRRVASLDDVETGTASDAAPASVAAPPAADRPNRDLVRRIQEGLNSAKIAELEADGVMGSRTEAAIRNFQAMQGLRVTGVPDETVLSKLKAVGASHR